MALEISTFISDLVATNPTDADQKAQGAAHLRLIKAALKTTLPGVTGAVTTTHNELNFVAGVTSGIQAQIAAEAMTRLNNDNAEITARQAATALLAPLASPALTGTPTVPTAAAGTATAQIATTAFVASAAFSAVLPGQTGNAGKLVTTNGTAASWTAIKTINGVSLLGAGDVSSGSLPYSGRTLNTTLNAADKGYLIDINIGAGAFTLAFDAVAALGAGWFIYLRNSGQADLTLDPSGAEMIDGLTSYVMYPGECRLIQCDGMVLRSVVLNAFQKTFTASGTFTRPPGYRSFSGFAWGAGGGGGASFGGGGGGACHPFNIPFAGVSVSQAFTIGAGGLVSSAGGNSSFGAVTAYGGGTGGNPGGGGGGGILSAGGVGVGGSPNTAAIATSGSVTILENPGFGGAIGGVSATYAAGNAAYGGAGGGHGTGATINNGGSSVYGGAGGASTGGIAGGSVFGGSGGAPSVAGSIPAGGGGLGAAGARGELRIGGGI